MSTVHPWQFFILAVAGWINHHQQEIIDYLVEENRVLKGQLCGRRLRLTYEYDFGDNWEHELLVEKIHPEEKGTHYPICLEGVGACPPEDVGGVPGYAEFLKAMSDPNHPEHQDYRDWIGRNYDPKKFDLTKINQILQNIPYSRLGGGVGPGANHPSHHPHKPR